MESLFSLIQQYAVPFIVVISIIVFVHEFGHYWVARRCGVRVESFSIGFGPKLFGWKDKHGTQWQVACLPLGGYVKMFGDADPASTPDESVKTMTEDEKKVSFFYQSVNKRMAIVAAGPAFNYLFAVILLAVLFVFQGQPFSAPVAGAVVENGAAAQAGMLPGDRVISIDGRTVSRFEDIRRIIAMNSGVPASLIVERDGERRTFTMTPEVSIQKDRLGGEHRMGKIGLVSKGRDHKKWSPPMAVRQAVVETWNISADTLRALGQIIVGTRGAEEIGGPLRIAEMSGEVSRDGAWALVWFMAVISINLGLINLFPIPLLDGGHLLFYSFEKLLGRPLDEKVQEYGFRLGLTVVLSFMLFAVWNDLVHLDVISKLAAVFS